MTVDILTASLVAALCLGLALFSLGGLLAVVFGASNRALAVAVGAGVASLVIFAGAVQAFG